MNRQRAVQKSTYTLSFFFYGNKILQEHSETTPQVRVVRKVTSTHKGITPSLIIYSSD